MTELHLPAATARDLMTPNPLTVTDDATLKEAAAILLDNGISALAVVDSAGRPIGVVSRSDFVRHEREEDDHLPHTPDYFEMAELRERSGTNQPLAGFEFEESQAAALVREYMTPIVFIVAPTASAKQVIDKMLERRVHRLFVAEQGGGLVGVISALDILKHVKA